MPIGISEEEWNALIVEASRVRKPRGPERTLAALALREDPFAGDNDHQEEQYRQALQADFGAIFHYRWSDITLTKEDRDVWVDRLAWLLQALEVCRQRRPGSVSLIAMLRTGAAFSSDIRIWQRLPSNYFSDCLLASLTALVGSTSCSFTTGGRSEPIWEREAIDDFLQADADQEWTKIENAWQTIVPSIRPDVDLFEATACLCASDKGRRALAHALDTCDSILPIACVAGAMTPDQIGQIAMDLTSDRGRFALIQSLVFNHPKNEFLSESVLDNLATVFRQVQQNEAEWQKWMKAFNRYPVRTKSIQRSFGKSMAGSKESAKTAYLEAIMLSTHHSECREAVTACLSEFCITAPEQERCVMWTLAFGIWETWDFGGKNRNNPLTCMAVSELDFALIGYAVECLSQSDLQSKLQTLATDLSAVRNGWYSDHLAFDAAWYRTLSRWQVFAYSKEARTGKDRWTMPSRVYLPFDPADDRYSALFLGTRLPFGIMLRHNN